MREILQIPRSRKGMLFGVVAAVVILLLGGFWYVFYQDRDASEVTLNYYSEFSALSLDPAAAVDPGSQVPLHNIYETLVTYEGEETSEVSPSLATSWYVSPNGMWYNFTLERGVTFSNGNSFEADDVEFSLDRAVSMYMQIGGSGEDLAEHVDLEGTRILDSYTLSIRLKEPFSGFLAVLAQPRPLSVIDRQYAIEHYSAADMFAGDFLNANPMGTGPYKLKSWDRGNKLVLVKNPSYRLGWDSQNIDRVVIYEARAVTERTVALSSGSADVVDVPLPNASEFLDLPDTSLESARGFSLQMIVMNVNTSRPSHAFMANPKVRQALAYAFDYGNISNSSYSGYLEHVNGCIPLGFPLEGESQPSKGFSYNLSLASEILNASGYTQDFTGHRFGGVAINLLLNRSNPTFESVASSYETNLERLGISVLLVNETARTIQVTRTWDMYLAEFVPRYVDPIDPVNSIAVSEIDGGDLFHSGIDNPYVDAEAAKGATSGSSEERVNSYKGIWTSLNAEPNVMFIGQVEHLHSHSLWIEGFIVNPVLHYSFYLYSKAS